jgi:hypothetical protein
MPPMQLAQALERGPCGGVEADAPEVRAEIRHAAGLIHGTRV